jgi:UDP-galactopyranose mutase
MYDYLIVGAGLFGSVFACEQRKRGKSVLVLDKRHHIGGNCFTDRVEGIQVHRYGAHIFHTSDSEVWEYMNKLAGFNRYTNSPIVRWKDKVYNLPFNMNTFNQLWGVTRPDQARAMIERQRSFLVGRTPENLEQQAISLVGTDIYERLVKGYTEKQWGRSAKQLPAFIIKRLPVRFTYDNNYFDDRFQGIPIGGYTQLFRQLLDGMEVRLGVDYLADRESFDRLARVILFTGPIDTFYGHRFGRLAYRSLRFETEVLETDNCQGNAVVNYTDASVPYTRTIEHKHFEFGEQANTVISREFPAECGPGDEPYYPINDEHDNALYAQYKELSLSEPQHLFGGRLAEYRYYDMDDVVRSALDLVRSQDVGAGPS